VPEVVPPTEAAVTPALAPAAPFVRLDRVRVTYTHDGQEIVAVEDATLQVGRGEFVAITGPSGCGKTSILKVLAGLLPASGGPVLVGGRQVAGPQKNVGMAFQNATLLPWRRTVDNVLLPLEIVEPHRRRFRERRQAYEAQARELLAAVGMAGFERRYPWQISGGQQQRVNLCRALIHEPELLLLDEPFGALDAFTREELWQVLQDLWLRQRFTVILVTHDLREAVFLADTVHVMSPRPGRIVHRTPVTLPRPRSLESTFTPAFTELYHEIRARIGSDRPG
jgi:NitT/TauT family transport system ATP-binding protein